MRTDQRPSDPTRTLAGNAAEKPGHPLMNHFMRGHALPLAGTRILRPRCSRGECAESPRDRRGSCPRTRHIHDLDSVANRTRSETFPVHELSVSAFSPRPRSCPRIIHVPAQATDSSVHGQAVDADTPCSQSVFSRDLSTTPIRTRTRFVPGRGLAANPPRRGIVVSHWPSTHFPIQIRVIPSYVLI